MNNKKILVTGGLGFIGSNLVDELVKNDNYEVFVIDDLSVGNKSYMNKKATYWFTDIRTMLDDEVFRFAIIKHKFDYIIHLAGRTRIQVSLEYPRETYDVNVNGTVSVCELARQCGSKLIYAGSSSYYGGSNKNPYSCSKHLGEEVVKTYSESYGLKYVICRFFNVYGERNIQDLKMGNVLGIFQKQYLENKPLTVTGDGEQSRDFTYVKDICTGLIKCAEMTHCNKIINLGRSSPVSVIALANMFVNNCEKKVKIEFIPERAGEQLDSCADITETIRLLKWVPTHNLEDYVKKWMLEHSRYGFKHVGQRCPHCLMGTLYWDDAGYYCSCGECTYYDNYVCEDYDLETEKEYGED